MKNHFNDGGKKKFIYYHCQEERYIKPKYSKHTSFDRINNIVPSIQEEKKEYAPFELEQIMSVIQPKIIEVIQQEVKQNSSSIFEAILFLFHEIFLNY